jgi:dienelactone hydrolase
VPSVSRRRWLVLILAAALVVLWSPVLKPAGQAAIVIADIFSEQLIGTNLARAITPEPRMVEDDGAFAGVPMRVTYWRPGWGDQHPAIMIVPGAAPRGNDEPIMRSFGMTLSRAGYLVMLPEFPFLKEGRFDSGATRQLDAAFAHARALSETQGRSVGAFGVSVGAGMMLVAAGREPALRDAAFLAVLGGYYDLDTYLASLASRTQRSANGLVPWVPSQEAQDRLPPGAVDLVPASARDAVRAALEPASYEVALGRIRALPAEARSAYDAVSPESVWSAIRPPIYWIHDPLDTFEPFAEAEAALAAPRAGHMRLVVPRLVSHAAPVGEEAKAQGPLYVAGELWRLITFTFEVLRLAG